MKRIGLALALFALTLALAAACAGGGSGPVAQAPSGAALERLLIAADDARDQALGGDPAALGCCFRGVALELLRRQASEAARRGGVAERPLQRRLVHTGSVPGGLEAVLEVQAEARPAGAAPASPAGRVIRQWSVLLRSGPGGWRIEEAQDLPPDRWWRT